MKIVMFSDAARLDEFFDPMGLGVGGSFLTNNRAPHLSM